MKKNRNLWLSLALLLAIFTLCRVSLAPSSGVKQNESRENVFRARARVESVDNSGVRTNLIVRTEEQILYIRLVSGPHKGAELDAINYLTGKMELDEWYRSGHLILVEYELTDGVPAHARPRGIYRLHLQMFLIALFGLLLLLLAGWTGFNAILSFVVSALMLWKLFFPLLLRGWPPLPTGLVLTALLTSVITLGVGGVNRRGIAAFAGSMLGVIFTCGLAVVFARAFALHGAVRPFSETLLYAGYYNLDLTAIFIASIFVASSGAVMDLAMDIASAMDEVLLHHPEIPFGRHCLSGLRISRAVIGTMTTTLLLAYSGSHITMFMLFIARGMPLANIFNTPLVSAEILNILVGSFGLVTVAPFTVLIAGLIYRRRNVPAPPS